VSVAFEYTCIGRVYCARVLCREADNDTWFAFTLRQLKEGHRYTRQFRCTCALWRILALYHQVFLARFYRFAVRFCVTGVDMASELTNSTLLRMFCCYFVHPAVAISARTTPTVMLSLGWRTDQSF